MKPKIEILLKLLEIQHKTLRAPTSENLLKLFYKNYTLSDTSKREDPFWRFSKLAGLLIVFYIKDSLEIFLTLRSFIHKIQKKTLLKNFYE